MQYHTAMSLIMFSSSGVLDPLKWEPPARYQYPTMCTRSVNSVLHTTVQDTAVPAVLHTYAHLNLDTFTCMASLISTVSFFILSGVQVSSEEPLSASCSPHKDEENNAEVIFVQYTWVNQKIHI